MKAKSKRRVVRRYFRVSMVLPYNASVGRAQEYVRDAVSCWKGGYTREDPMVDLKTDTIRVAIIGKEKRKWIRKLG